jgi:hypothetical protein
MSMGTTQISESFIQVGCSSLRRLAEWNDPDDYLGVFAGIFSDGFESGGTGQWSSTVN